MTILWSLLVLSGAYLLFALAASRIKSAPALWPFKAKK